MRPRTWAAEAHKRERQGRLAQRLDTVRQGGQPEALEPWMEELYRRVSDRRAEDREDPL